MLRWIGSIILTVGCAFLLYVGYLLYDFYQGSNYQIQAAEEYLSKYGYDVDVSERIDQARLMNREDFTVELGDTYATLDIPTIGLTLPVIYGSELEYLRHGVGHDPETWFPGDGNQIFLAGHNDSAFLNVGDLVEGDSIFINTPYGKYEYLVDHYEVGHETETWRVGDMDEEVLVLMTCYPFFSLTRPEQRYFVYAKPI